MITSHSIIDLQPILAWKRARPLLGSPFDSACRPSLRTAVVCTSELYQWLVPELARALRELRALYEKQMPGVVYNEDEDIEAEVLMTFVFNL